MKYRAMVINAPPHVNIYLQMGFCVCLVIPGVQTVSGKIYIILDGFDCDTRI